jgi:hypothetical protein
MMLVVTSLGLGFGFVLGAAVPVAFAKAAKDTKAKPSGGAAPVASDAHKVNKCGCYQDTQGNCFCGKKGKCECPGECEPKGCDEKRAKQIEKEIAIETKKAAEADKKQKRSSGAGDKDKAADKGSEAPADSKREKRE